MKVTGYSETFILIFKKIVVRNKVVLPELPEQLQNHLQEKQVRQHEQSLGHRTTMRGRLDNSGLFTNADDTDLFCSNFTSYCVLQF